MAVTHTTAAPSRSARKIRTGAKETTMTTMTRRTLLRALAASPALALGVPRLAHAGAEFSYKYAHNLPMTHPLHLRAQEAVDRIRKESNGRLEITIFPNNQL